MDEPNPVHSIDRWVINGWHYFFKGVELEVSEVRLDIWDDELATGGLKIPC